MANNKFFLAKNGIATSGRGLFGTLTDNGIDSLQVSGSSIFDGFTKISGQAEITNSVANTYSLLVKNTANSHPANLAQFIGDSNAFHVINSSAGVYDIGNANNVIRFYANTQGLDILYNNSSRLSITSTGNDFTGLANTTIEGFRILTTADEGSGNGLDADTIDGLDSTQFLRSDQDDTMAGSLTIQGDLTVSGNTTYVDTETILLSDNIITLNANHTGAPTQDAGIEVNRGSSANSYFLWSESNDEWKFDNDVLIATANPTLAFEGTDSSRYIINVDQSNTRLELGNNVNVNAYLNADGSTQFNYALSANSIVSVSTIEAGTSITANTTITAGTDVLGQRFVDVDNNIYYVDPAGSSVMNDIGIDDIIFHNGDGDTYIGFLADDQFEVATAGIQRLVVTNTRVDVSVDLYVPRIIDKDNNSYLVDPAGTSVVNKVGIDDDLFHNGNNTTKLSFDNNQIDLITASTSRIAITNTSVTIQPDLYAPKLIDSNNNNYYVDPHSFSQFFAADFDGTVTGVDITLTGDVEAVDGTFSGLLTANNLSVSSDATFEGDVQIQGQLEVWQSISSNTDIFAVNRVYASQFRDIDNTTFYGDFASTSRVNNIALAGVIRNDNNSTTYLDFPALDRFSIFTNNVERLRVNDAFIQSYVDFRAPIYFDGNDLNYYGDFNSTSNINNINLDGIIHDWNDPDTKIDFDNPLITDSIRFTTNATARMYITNSYVRAVDSVQSPIYYDLDNTAFLGDFAGRSYFNTLSLNVTSGATATNATLDIEGPLSLRTTSPLYFGVSSSTINSWTGRIYNRTGTTLALDAQIFEFGNVGYTAGSIGMTFASTTQALDVFGSVIAPIYYDRNDVTYYGDFASTSRINNLGLVGQIIHDGDADTYLQFPNNNEFNLTVGGVNGLSANTTVLSTDLDFNSSGDITAGGAVYAPRYYDSDDNNYYGDFASTSVLNKLHVGTSLSLDDGTDPDISTGIIFSTTKVVTPKLVFLNDGTGDDNYLTVSDNNNAYTVTGRPMGAWWEFTGDKIAADGAASSGLVASGIRSSFIEAKSEIWSPVYYDQADQGYYWDPNEGNAHRFQTTSGYVRIGPQNTSYSHFNTDRPQYYFDKPVAFDGNIFGYSGTETASFDYFYDSGDTSYYLDPQASSRLNRINLVDKVRSASDTTNWIKFPGTDDFEVVTNSVQRLYVNNTEVRAHNITNFYAPNLIDVNDNAYYLQPNSGPLSLTMAGGARMGIITDGDRSGDSSGNGGIALNTYGWDTATSNPYFSMSGGAGGYALASLNRIGTPGFNPFSIDNTTLDMRVNGTSAASFSFDAANTLYLLLNDATNGAAGGNNFQIWNASFAPIFLANHDGTFFFNTYFATYTQNDNTPLVGSVSANKYHFEGGSIQLNGANDAIVFGGATATFLKDEELAFGWGGGWYMTDATYLRVRNDKTIFSGGNIELTGDVYANRYYDANATTRWIEPGGGGRLEGNFEFAASSTALDYSVAAIELRESNYTANGSAIPPRISFHWGGIVASQIAVESNGTIAIRNNPGTGYEKFRASQVTASIFYDADDVNYLVDPRGASRLNGLRVDGHNGNNVSGDDAIIWIPKINNNDWSVLSTGGYDYGFEHRGPAVHSYSYSAVRSGTRYFRVGTDYAYHDQSFRAPRFYDYNNTNYYGDFASISVMNAIGIDDLLFHNGDTDTFMQFPTADEWRVVTGGSARLLVTNTYTRAFQEIRAPRFVDIDDQTFFADPAGESRLNTIKLDGNEVILSEPTATFGSLQVDGGGRNGYEGFSIGGRSVFMHDNSTVTGIYDDVNNNWFWYGENQSVLRLMYAGVEQARTENGYFLANNQIRSPIFYDSNNTGYYVDPNDTSYVNVLRTNRIYPAYDNNTAIYIDYPTGDYGSIQVNGGGKGQWEGYSINGRFVLMSSDSSVVGLYNDTDNEWMQLWYRNSGTVLYYNGIQQAETASGYFLANNEMRAPIYYGTNNTSYYFNPNNQTNNSTQLRLGGQINRTNFNLTGGGDDNKFLVSQDYSSWVWNTAGNWGIFWAGNDNPSYSYFGTTNPNEMVFVGQGNVRASIDLDTGDAFFGGEVYADNYNITGPAGNISLNPAYGSGGADLVLFDYTSYSEAEITAPIQGAETNSVTEYVEIQDSPFAGKTIRTTGYIRFYSDYIPVVPGEVIYGEISEKYVSGPVQGRTYFGVERFDKDKNPITSNTGTTYFVRGGQIASNTGWETRRAHTTIPTSHTPYNGSDGGGVHYVRIRILMNYPDGTGQYAERYYGGIMLKRRNAESNLLVDDLEVIDDLTVGGDANITGDLTVDDILADVVDANIFRDRTNTGRFMDPVSGASVAGTWNWNNNSIINLNNLTFNDPGVNEGIKWENGNQWQIYESPDNQTNAAGNLQFTAGSGSGTRNFWIDTSGNSLSRSGSYATRFYDRNDPNYYADPALRSQFRQLTVGEPGNTIAPFTVLRQGSGGTAGNSVGALFLNSFSNHSWGLLAEFRTEGTGGDRPSISFSSANSPSYGWSTGMFQNNNWQVRLNHGYRWGSWGTPILELTADSNRDFYHYGRRMYGRAWYDLDNTNYYLDPAGTSIVNILDVNTLTADNINGIGEWYGDIVINGDENTYYPVTWYGGNQDKITEIEIYRGYAEQAPWNPINTGVHRGALTLKMRANFGGWGGSNYDFQFEDFRETYTTIASDVARFANNRGLVIWLRGGGSTGALYHVRVSGRSTGPTVSYSTYDPGGNGSGVSPRTDTPQTNIQNHNHTIGPHLQANASYSYIYYDRNNTGYYGDFASTSRMNEVQIYGSGRFLGGAPAYFWTSSNNLRGYIRATETNDGHFEFATSGGEDFVFRDGGFGGAWNQIIRGDGDVLINRSLIVPIMYDRNSTGYYVDPASFSNMGTGIRATEYYARGWFRNDSSGTGLYNTQNAMHWYSDTTSRWRLYSTSSTAQILFTTAGNNPRGYVYADNGNSIGFLNASGGWALRTNFGTTEVYGNLVANQFVDRNNSGYYVNPESASQLNAVYANNWFRAQGSTGLYFQSYGYGLRAAGAGGNPYGNVTTFNRGQNSWDGYSWANDFSLMSDVNNGGVTIGLYDVSYGWVYRYRRDQRYFYLDRLTYATDFRPSIIYDRDNSGYYSNPSATSRLNVVITNESYTYGWFRNYSNGRGLYSQATGQHWYSDSASGWNVAGSGSANWIRMRPGGYGAAVRGYWYADTSNNIGILTSDGNWRIRANYNYLDIYGDAYANRYYDRNNSGYYVDPASSSQLSAVFANNWFRAQGGTGLYFQSYGRGLRAPDASGAPYGNVVTYGGGRNGWRGYTIENRWSFMSTGGDNVGIHDNSITWHWYFNGSYNRWYRGNNYFDGDVRGSVFYDRYDTGYYHNGAYGYSRTYNGHSNPNTVYGGEMYFRRNTHWSSYPGIDYIGGAGEFRMSSNSGALNLRCDGWGYFYNWIQSIGPGYFPFIYDRNDSNYSLDLNSTSQDAMKIRGGIRHGPNPTWGAYLRVGTNGRYDSWASVMTTNGNLHLDCRNGYSTYVNWYSGGITYFQADIRPTLMYDRNNTGYYANPASTSRFNYNVTNRIKLVNNVNNNPRWDFSAYVMEAQHWYGNNYSQTMYLGEAGNAVQIRGTPRAPIWYDYNNTSYYANPNGYSSMYSARFWGNATFIRGTSPTLYFEHTDGDSFMWHCNSSWMYLLRGSGNTTSWSPSVSGWWPYYVRSSDYLTYIGGEIRCRGNIIAYWSDERLKEKVGTVDNALEKILSLNPFLYRENELAKEYGFNDDKVQMGFSAQEVQKVAPEIVSIAVFDQVTPGPDDEDPDDDLVGTSASGENYLTMDYGRMTPLIVAAMKEQQEIINNQQKQIEELREMILALSNK